jgi:hypothetical protein
LSDYPDSSIAWRKRAAVTTAKAVIAGEHSLIEGCVGLSQLAPGLVPQWHDDPDFLVFGVVASDTDHFPTGSARQYWNPVALAREDKRIAQYEAKSREDIIAACQNIIARFSDA